MAILFTDLVGFSSWALEAGDRSAMRLLREVGEAIEPPILERQGEVVKRLGDGLMAAFWDAPSAVEAAFAARERAARDRGRRLPRRGCAPASTSAGRASSAATTSASTSTSPPASPRRRSPARSSSPTAPWRRSAPRRRRGEEAPLQRQGRAEGDGRLRDQPDSRLTISSSSSSWLSRTNSASGPASASPSSFMPR